jgi:hypothetical protein
MADHEKHEHTDEYGRTIAALFQSREEARSAVKPLHKAHYKQTWIGTTSIAEKASGDPVTTVETGGFFSGTESLIDTLVKRGVHGDAARSLETRIEPGNAVLTVDPKDHGSQEAIDILTRHGGRVASGASSPDWGAWPPPLDMSDALDGLDDEEFEEALYSRR